MKFNILLDHKLKSEYFNPRSFNKDSYNTAWTQLLQDTNLFCWWSSLCNLICGGHDGSEEAMEVYLRKFVKGRCVYHLMKGNLSPLSGHTAAIRVKLTQKSAKSESMKEPSPTDVCKRCNMLGHWAKNCKNAPEPDWLAKQVCFKCGLKGHLAAQCVNNIKTRYSYNKRKTKWLNLPAMVGLLQSEDLESNPNYKPLKDDPPPGIADVRPYLKQRSEAWKEARKNILNASKAGVITGHFGLSQAQSYWRSAVQGQIEGSNDSTSIINKLAMEWGTVCEDCARVSYLKFLAGSCYDFTIFETGLWTINYKDTDMFGCSPDDIVVIHGTGLHGISGRGIVEYKCPFKGGYPSHYKQLPACYYMQMQLNMKATNADWCRFVMWTPQTTRVYTVMRNDSFIGELLDAVHKHFWNLTAPPTSLHPKLKEIERKAKENSEKIKMVVEVQSYSSLSSIPHLSTFSPENIDIQVTKEKRHKSLKPEKQNKRILHCSKCRRPLVICNQDKCIDKRNSACAKKSLFKDDTKNTQLIDPKQPQVSLLFSSYVNGSNTVTNSCHQDAFLVVMSEILNRNSEFMRTLPTNPQQTKALQALKSVWKFNCDGKYHDSKMALWLWLQNETCNGRIYYRLGNQCSLEGIIHSLHHYMGQEERKFFSFVTLVSRKCSKFSDHRFTLREQCSGTFKIIVDEIDPEDRTDPSDQISPVSLVKYFKRRITPGGYSCFSGICSYTCQDKNEGKASMGTCKCSQPAVRTTTVKQVPNLIIFESFKADPLPLKWDPHVDQELDVLQEKYKLTGLIYHSQARAHYWSEVYVDSSNAYCVNPGWYAHDGLVNGGKCIKTGDKPKSESHGRHLSLAFFERLTSIHVCHNTEPPTCQTPEKTSARTWSQTDSSPSGNTPLRKKRQ